MQTVSKNKMELENKMYLLSSCRNAVFFMECIPVSGNVLLLPLFFFAPPLVRAVFSVVAIPVCVSNVGCLLILF